MPLDNIGYYSQTKSKQVSLESHLGSQVTELTSSRLLFHDLFYSETFPQLVNFFLSLMWYEVVSFDIWSQVPSWQIWKNNIKRKPNSC